MHPDALLEALKVELEEATDEAHKRAIKAEMDRVDKLPRPVVKPEEPETVFSRPRAILDALKTELEEAVSEKHKDAVKAEIKRIEELVHKSEGSTAAESTGDPTEPAEEVLSDLSRAELNARAAELGVEDADKLPNKDTVIDAIEAARAA